MIEGSVVFEGVYNGTDIVIRHCRRDDVEKLLEFINTLSREQTYIIFQGEQMTLEEESRYVEGYLKKVEEHRAVKLLVFHKDELIGVGDITPKERAEDHIGVFGLTIKKEWRGKGIGKFLMQKVLIEAEKHIVGMKIVTLGVYANNPIAKNLYLKMGFIEYGLLPGGVKRRGEFVDHIYMYKLVSS